ncbi:hypothetical protein [Pontitalea aquivivens]|uniref:hypothetical protein n=1 Tax=Pontitalea aquivivens TaxID=3388663 RepID=UPI00397112DC
MKLLRCPLLLTALLVFALTLGGFSRGMAEGAGAARAQLVEMVICSDMGARIVLVDRDGAARPAEDCDLTFCPDCMQAGAVALGLPSYDPTQVRGFGRALRPTSHQAPVLRRVRLAQARAPPLQKA